MIKSNSTTKRKIDTSSLNNNNEDEKETVEGNNLIKEKEKDEEEKYLKEYLKKPKNIPDEYMIFKAVRLVAVLVWVCTFTVLVWISVPFNYILLDPLCRYLKTKERNFSLEVLSRVWAKGILFLLNIEVHVEDDYDIGSNTSGQAAVMLYNHSSYLDPVILAAYSPIPSRYIFKQELLYILPVVFILAYLVGHIPINRKKKDSAIVSINEAADVISRENKCVVISPEGTRSETGKLYPFKKGPFHMALKSNAKVIPVTLFGNQHLWPSTQLLPNSGNAYIRFLKPITIPKNSNVESLSELTRETMLKSLSKLPNNYIIFPCKPSAQNALLFILLVAPLLFLIVTILKFYIFNILLN